MNRLFLISTAFLIGQVSLHAQTSYLPFASTLNEGGTEFSFSTEYFSTASIADYDSQVTDLTDGLSHQRLDFDIYGKYGFTSQLEGQLGVRGRYIQSAFTGDFGSGVEEIKLTKTGAESTVVGLKYSFKEVERTKYSLEGWYRHSMHSSDIFVDGTEPEEVILGDDSREYAVGIDFYFKTKDNNVFDFQVFYRSPGEDLSKEIFSKVQFGFIWEYASLYAGVENVYSLDGDPYTDNPNSKPVLFQQPSNQYNSINRQWTAPYLGMGFALGTKWRMKLQYTQVTTGRSTDLGPRVFLGLSRRSNPNDKTYQKRDSKFKQYRVDGVVTKLSKSKKVVVVDKGIQDGLKRGMKVDFYYFNFIGGNELIGSGIVVKAKLSESLVQVTKKFSRRRVKEGTVMRAGELED
jgi:hypothetical protein